MPLDVTTINAESDRLFNKLQNYYLQGAEVFYRGFDRNFPALRKVYNQRAQYEEDTDTSLPPHAVDTIVQLYAKRTKLDDNKWEVDWNEMGKALEVGKGLGRGGGNKEGEKAEEKGKQKEYPKPTPIRRQEDASTSKKGTPTTATKATTSTDTRKQAPMKPVVEIVTKAATPKTTTTTENKKAGKVAKAVPQDKAIPQAKVPPPAAKTSKLDNAAKNPTTKNTSAAASTSKARNKQVVSKSDIGSDTDEVELVEPKKKGKGRKAQSESEGEDEDEGCEEGDQEEVKPVREPTPPLVLGRRRSAAKRIAGERIFKVFGKCSNCTKDAKPCVYTQGRVNETKDTKKVVCDYCKGRKRRCMPYGPAALTFDTLLGDYEDLLFPNADGTIPRRKKDGEEKDGEDSDGEDLEGEDSDAEKDSDEDMAEDEEGGQGGGSVKSVGDLFVTLLRKQRVLAEKITALDAKLSKVMTAVDTHPQHATGLTTAINNLIHKVEVLDNIRRDKDHELMSKFSDLSFKFTTLQMEVISPKRDPVMEHTIRMILADVQKLAAAQAPPPQPTPLDVTADDFATSQSASARDAEWSGTKNSTLDVDSTKNDGEHEGNLVGAGEGSMEEEQIGGDGNGPAQEKAEVEQKGDGDNGGQDGDLNKDVVQLDKGEGVQDVEHEQDDDETATESSTAGMAGQQSAPKRTTRSNAKEQPESSAAAASRTKPPSNIGAKRKANASPEPEQGAPGIGPGAGKKGKGAKKVKM